MVCGFATMDALELRPWFGTVLEIEGRAESYLEVYHSLNGEHGDRDRPACDVFVDFSASLAPTENWSVEVEALTGDTRHRSFGMDSVLLTGRYLWLNDIIGDPLSLATGLTVTKVFKPARYDVAIFHHGGVACEATVAAGKEFSCEQFWTSRYWAVGGVGMGDIGSAWVRGDAAWEHNWWDLHLAGIFLNTLWGFGRHALDLEKPFRGYGPIEHQSIDLGLRYRLALECGLALKVEYAYRVFARNCPQHVNWVNVGIFYPFGL